MKCRRGGVRARWWVMAGFVLVFFTVAMSIAWWIFGMAADRKLAQQVRQARDEGLILELDEILPKEGLTASENAGPSYLEAAQRSRSLTPQFNDLRWLFGPILARAATSGERIDARVDLAKIEPILRLVRRGASKPSCDFRRNWSEGFNLSFRDLPLYRQCGTALAVDAVLRAAEGQDEQAFADLCSLGRLSAHLMAQPSIVEMEAGNSLLATCFSALERVMAEKPLTRERALRVAAVARACGPYVTLRQSLRCEPALGRDALERMGRGEPDFGDDMASQLARVPSVRRQAHIELISRWREAFRGLVTERVDYQRTRAAMDKLDDQARVGPVASLMYIFPPLSGRVADKAEGEVKRRILLTAASVFAQWSRSGSWPQAMPDLGLDSLDPFSTRPLRYVRCARGFKLYSLGRDCVDDQGHRLDPKAPGVATFDVVFEYPLPAIPRSTLYLYTRPSAVARPSRGPATPSASSEE